MSVDTEKLKELLDKVTPDWRVSHVHDEDGWYGSAVYAGETEVGWFEDNPEPDQHYATLIALAPTLAAEVVRLREALDAVSRTYKADSSRLIHSDMRIIEIARQALDAAIAK